MEEEEAETLRELHLGGEIGLIKVDSVEESLTIDLSLWFHYNLKDGSESIAEPSPVATRPPRPWGKAEYVDKSAQDNDLEWKPSFYFWNLIEEPKVVRECYYQNRTTHDVFGSMNWIIVIQDYLALKKFPWDSQLFSIKLTVLNDDCFLSPWSQLNPIIYDQLPRVAKSFFVHPQPQIFNPATGVLEPPNVISSFQVAILRESDSWRLRDTSVSFLDPDEPYLMVRVYLDRKPNFYIRTIYVIFFFIVLSSNLVLTIDIISDIASRASFQVTLLLTAVAFQTTVTTLVPQSCYFSRLDIFIFIGFLLIFSAMIKDFSLNMWFSEISIGVTVLDKIFHAVFTGAWMLVTFTFSILGAYRDSERTLQNYDATSSQIKHIADT